MATVYIFLFLLTVAPVHSQNWGSFQQDHCTANCQRQFSAILWNIPWGKDWTTACKNTPANINNKQFSGAKRCPQSWGRQWGQFDVPDTSCCPYWGTFQRDDCTYNCRRQYSVILWNIQSGSDWEATCKNTPANINGNQFSGAKRCPQSWGRQYGEFDVPDTSCCPYWGSFKLDSCSQTPGRGIYSAILYEIPRLESWESSCANFGATIGGQTVSKPTECDNTGLNMWGKFDIIYDETIASSSTTCYAFEYGDADTECPEHDELRKRRKRTDSCRTRGESVNYWITAVAIVIQALRELNNQPRTQPILPIPEPNTIQNFPGLEGTSVPNSFVFDGRYVFRLLRNQNDENYRRERSSNYQTKPSEGNGLSGLSPADPNSAATIYEHITNGQLHTRYISTSSDFGRTQDLAIECTLNNYQREQTQQIDERSRWFVQIDVSNLPRYEVTNPDVFGRTCLPPSGGLPIRVCRNVRRWSELLVEGAIPSRYIVRTFQVYAVNATYYVLNVLDNSDYRP